jgi:hypothetical protein
MNEQERIDNIIRELEEAIEIYDGHSGFIAGIDHAIRVIRSYYPTKEQQNDNV